MARRPLARQLDHFAETLAQSAGTSIDGDLAAIAGALGLKPKEGRAMFRRICQEQGWVGD